VRCRGRGAVPGRGSGHPRPRAGSAGTAPRVSSCLWIKTTRCGLLGGLLPGFKGGALTGCAMPCHAMLCHAVPCHAVPCNALPCCAIPHVPCRAMPCCAMPHVPCHTTCAMPCHAVPCHAVPCCIVPCCAVPSHVMLCHPMPYCAMLCCALLCLAVPYRAVPCHAQGFTVSPGGQLAPAPCGCLQIPDITDARDIPTASWVSRRGTSYFTPTHTRVKPKRPRSGLAGCLVPGCTDQPRGKDP